MFFSNDTIYNKKLIRFYMIELIKIRSFGLQNYKEKHYSYFTTSTSSNVSKACISTASLGNSCTKSLLEITFARLFLAALAVLVVV